MSMNLSALQSNMPFAQSMAAKGSNSIRPPIDARAFLVEPSAAMRGMSVEQVRSEAGVWASTIDSVIKEITGFSILEEWVVKVCAGNWPLLSKAADAWEHSGKAVGAVAENMRSLPGLIGTRWTGEAAMAFSASQAKVSGALMVFQPLSAGMKQWVIALIELGTYIVKMILAVIKELSYKTSGMLAAAATVIGALSVPAWVASIVQSVVAWTKRIKEAIDLFRKFVEQVKEIIAAVQRAARAIQIMLATAQAVVGAAGGGDSAFSRGLGSLQGAAVGTGKFADGVQKSNDALLDSVNKFEDKATNKRPTTGVRSTFSDEKSS